jgi:predicted Ser/Thr protein kinase
MPSLAGRMLDHYRLIEQVGQGGMATVYRARDTRNDADVAIKVLSPTISDDRRFVRRFRREAGLLVRLKHPNIVHVLDYGESNGLAYLVMPFVDGDTLNDRINKGRLSVQETGRWVGELTSALEFAHEKGVIHRDVKPSNVLIDSSGKAMLTDFGLARFIEGSNTLTGSMMMGTPAYVSPEQGRGQKLDGRADQYSLGVILYQMATGRLPFEGDSPMSTVLMHIQEAVPRPSRFNRNLPLGIERVIIKCLAKDPANRFESMKALNEAYQAALRGESLAGLDVPLTVAAPGLVRAPVKAAEPRRRGGVFWMLLASVPVLIALGLLVVPSMLSGFGGAPAVTQPAPQASPSLAAILLPTSTPELQASATPVESVACPGIRLISFGRQGQQVSWVVDNGTTEPVKIVNFEAAVPLANSIKKISLGDLVLFDAAQNAALDSGGQIHLGADASAAIQPNVLMPLILTFEFGDAKPGYRMTLELDRNCVLQADW